MKYEMEQIKIDFNAKHVVWENPDGKICFAQRDSQLHKGCRVLASCPDFESAAKVVKDLGSKNEPK